MPTGSTAHDYTPLNGTRDRFYFLYSALVDEGVIDPGGLYGPAQRDRQRLAWRRMKDAVRAMETAYGGGRDFAMDRKRVQ